MTDKTAIATEKSDDETIKLAATKEIKDSKMNGKLNIHHSGNKLENMLSSEVFPNFVFLGTGSACSQYNRNSSGILVNIS